MGGQTTDQGFIEFKFQTYLFQIRVISEKEVDLQAIDTKTFQKFSLNSHIFSTQINSSTLIAAFQRKEDSQFIKLSVSHGQDSEKEQFLKISLKVTYDFIPHFEEVIIMPIDKNVNEQDMIQTQMKLVNSEMRDLQVEFDALQVKADNKVVVTCKSGTYNSASNDICKIELKKGKYEVVLTFYSSSIYNLIYMKLMNNQTGVECLKLPEQLIYFTLAQSQQYQPHILRSIVDIKEDNQTLTLTTLNSNSYTWNMKNLVLSATQI